MTGLRSCASRPLRRSVALVEEALRGRRFVVENEEPELPIGLVKLAAEGGLEQRLDALSKEVASLRQQVSEAKTGKLDWLTIVPIAQSRSSYNGLLLFFFIALAAGLGAEIIHRFASASLRRAAAWDCGFPDPSPATQYTAASFSQPIRRVFGSPQPETPPEPELVEMARQARKMLSDALDAFMRRESESLAGQIKSEHDDRVESEGGTSRELRETAKSLERRISAVDALLARSQRELRQQMLDQHQNLSNDIRQKIEEVLAALSRETGELRADKADRAALASLLTEMALRLTNDLHVPGAEDIPNA